VPKVNGSMDIIAGPIVGIFAGMLLSALLSGFLGMFRREEGSWELGIWFPFMAFCIVGPLFGGDPAWALFSLSAIGVALYLNFRDQGSKGTPQGAGAEPSPTPPSTRKSLTSAPNSENAPVKTDVRILRCPNCSQALNAPVGKKLKITCPKCDHIWMHTGRRFDDRYFLPDEMDDASRETQTMTTTAETNAGILRCAKCNQAVRVLEGRLDKVACPSCGNSWVHDGRLGD
jgi:phage FluMu protein Com